MAISLTPEDKKLIQKRMKTGLFKSVEEVIHDAQLHKIPRRNGLATIKVRLTRKSLAVLPNWTAAKVLQVMSRARLQRRKGGGKT